MKKLILFVSMMAVALPLAAMPHTTLAEDSDRSADDASTLQTQAEDTLTAEKLEKLKERVETRKEELKTRLTEVKERAVKNRCKAAQEVIAKKVENIETKVTRRSTSHEKLTVALQALIARVETEYSEVDLSVVKAAQTELAAKVAAYTVSVEAYQQTLSDLAIMDCESDPSGFQASLEAARTERQELAREAAGVRSYIEGTLKPAVKELRETIKELKDQTQTTEEETN